MAISHGFTEAPLLVYFWLKPKPQGKELPVKYPMLMLLCNTNYRENPWHSVRLPMQETQG